LAREKVINDLNKLYTIAHSLNDAGQMTQANFLSLNLALAYTTDVYKMKPHDGRMANKVYKVMGKYFEKFPNDLLERISNFFTPDWPSDLEKATIKVNSFLPMVIYTDHKYGIAPDTFVDQYLNFINPGAVLFFDVSSKIFVQQYTPEQRERLEQANEAKVRESNIDIKQRELSGGEGENRNE
jgi:hypothetical protein